LYVKFFTIAAILPHSFFCISPGGCC